jgi:hypothetical protein
MFNDVMYVPSLTKKLSFVSKATSQGYSVEFGDDVCQLKNSKKYMVVHGI